MHTYIHTYIYTYIRSQPIQEINSSGSADALMWELDQRKEQIRSLERELKALQVTMCVCVCVFLCVSMCVYVFVWSLGCSR